MTDTPYTPEDLPEAEMPPAFDPGAADPSAHGHSDDFDPGSPAADAPAVF